MANNDIFMDDSGKKVGKKTLFSERELHAKDVAEVLTWNPRAYREIEHFFQVNVLSARILSKKFKVLAQSNGTKEGSFILQLLGNGLCHITSSDILLNWIYAVNEYTQSIPNYKYGLSKFVLSADHDLFQDFLMKACQSYTEDARSLFEKVLSKLK